MRLKETHREDPLGQRGAMRDHKSLIAWQRARTVVDIVLRASQHHWRPAAAPVLSQLQRASLSVQLNIAEGYALRSRKQFRRHLTIAYGSAVETLELLEIAAEHQLMPPPLVSSALGGARECCALLLGLLRRYA